MSRKFLKINSTPEWQCLFQLFGKGCISQSPVQPPTSYTTHNHTSVSFSQIERRKQTYHCASLSIFAELTALCSYLMLVFHWGSFEYQHRPAFASDNEVRTKTRCHKNSSQLPNLTVYCPPASSIFVFCPWHLVAICPWSKPSASLFFSFLICKMKMTVVLTLQHDGMQCGLVPVAKQSSNQLRGRFLTCFGSWIFWNLTKTLQKEMCTDLEFYVHS